MILERNSVQFSEKYDEISWVIRIILGGALNIVFLNALSTFIETHITYEAATATYYITNLWTPSLFPQFVTLVVMVLIGPFLVSLLLTKREPTLKIVPPFYVAIFGFAWILIFWLIPYESIRAFLAIVFGVTLLFVGRMEDRLVTSVLGIATDRECIYFEHLRVYAQIEEVKARLSVPEIMDNLFLSDRVEGNAEQGYMFRTERGYDVVNKILLVRDEHFPETPITNVKIAYYYKKRYNVQFSPTFLENCRRTSGYIRDIFLNRDRDAAMPLEVIVPLTNNVRDPLIDSIIDELMGYYARSKRLSRFDKIKIGAVLGIATMTVGLFVFDQPQLGVASIVLDTFLALSELPDIVRRSK
jgi:hypothetical protein